MTPDDLEDLAALKALWWWLDDLRLMPQIMEYLYRTAQSQDDMKELLMLHRLNQRMRTKRKEARGNE